jgi:hypothetical protein
MISASVVCGFFDQRDRRVDDLGEVVRRNVASPCPPRCPRCRSPAGSEPRGQHLRLHLAVVVVGRKSTVSLSISSSSAAAIAPAALRCTASPPADRRPPSRSCPARPPAGSASKTAAPCAPARRRPPNRRAGGYLPITSPTILAHLRVGRLWSAPSRSCRTGCAGAPASVRRGHRAARGR